MGRGAPWSSRARARHEAVVGPRRGFGRPRWWSPDQEQERITMIRDIIATSSVAGLNAYPGGAVYRGTKWFVRDFMEDLRMESAMEGTNIRTATIYPAAINTELLGLISHKETADVMQNLYNQYGIS